MSYLPKVSLKISRLDKVLDGMANNKKKEKEKGAGGGCRYLGDSGCHGRCGCGGAHPLCAGSQGREPLPRGGGGGRGRTAEEQDEQGAYGELPHQGGHTR